MAIEKKSRSEFVSDGKKRAWTEAKIVADTIQARKGVANGNGPRIDLFVHGRRKGSTIDKRRLYSVLCPYCCGTHLHSVEDKQSQYGKIIGHVIAPCNPDGNCGYFIVVKPISVATVAIVIDSRRRKMMREIEREDAQKRREEREEQKTQDLINRIDRALEEDGWSVVDEMIRLDKLDRQAKEAREANKEV